MKKDITKPEVKQVTLAVTRKKNDTGHYEWQVHIINKNDFDLENTLVTSKGYGEKNGEVQKTSVLRHFVETVAASSTALIEPIDPNLFHLTNEYWLSYYVGKEVFDKKFLFMPGSITEENITYIAALDSEGILHS